MSLTDHELSILRDYAVHAALAAGEIIASYQGQQISYQLKQGGTSVASRIVTQVDKEAEIAILEVLNASITEYDLGLLTEESTDNQTRFEKDYFWCIDPLDGTLPFLRNESGYATSIALVSRQGRAVLGVVNDPRNNNLYTAINGNGAYKNHDPFKRVLSDGATTIDNGPGGAVMQALLTIENSPSIFFKKPKPEEGGGCLWDYAASSIIHYEAGGVNSDFNGKPLELNAKHSVFMNHCGVWFASGDTPQLRHEVQSHF